MTITYNSLIGQITDDFTQACAELAQARLHQRLKDSKANRSAVAEWRDKIDALLDMFLETERNRVVKGDPWMAASASAAVARSCS